MAGGWGFGRPKTEVSVSKRVAIVAGGRTPFVKAGKAFKDLGPLKMATHAVTGLIEVHNVDAATIEAIAFGAVVPEPGKPNIAREVVLEAGLPRSIEAQTVSSYCITGLRSITAIAEGIASGRIEVGIAGRSGVPIACRSSNVSGTVDRAFDGRAHGDHHQRMAGSPKTTGRDCACESSQCCGGA